MHQTSEEATVQADKATLYVKSEMMGSIQRIEARNVKVIIGRYAQYSHAVKVECLPKGKRRAREFVQAYCPSLVILEGWGHPEPPSMFGAPVDRGPVLVSESRYSAFDPRWQSDFDAVLADYVAKSGARILADYRQHNTKQVAV